jgi:hypothetical protein
VSDYHATPTKPKASKEHQCIACGWIIPKGEGYVQQEGFFDSRAYRNRYHSECWDELNAEDAFEFVTGDIEPPARLLTPIEEVL